MYNASRVRYVPVRQGVTISANSIWMKRMGKLVYSVSFLTESGNKLPGGAQLLERCGDGEVELPFGETGERLGIKEDVAEKTTTGWQQARRL